MSCNASKGAKELEAWLESNYCIRKGITETSVAQVVRNALSRRPVIELNKESTVSQALKFQGLSI